MACTVAELYGEIWGTHDPEFEAAINQSLNPRSPDTLYEMFGALGVGCEHLVLDIGCRDSSIGVLLAQRFGCRVLGVDPIPQYLEWSRKRIAEAIEDSRVSVSPGSMESLPVEDRSIDFIWSRDMINHVDLTRGFPECRRVLRPGGSMLVYTTLAKDRLEPREARRLYEALAIVPENMSPAYIEHVARLSGFEIALNQEIGSEWREADLEKDNNGKSLVDLLLRISRLLRQEADLVRRFGRARFEATYAGEMWVLNILFGKLCPTVYILEPSHQTSL